MTSWRALHSLAVIAFWGAIGLTMALMVVPTAGSDWWSHVVAVGTFVLYTRACVAFVRDRRRA